MSLTAKQELFCQEYIIDLNATQAAIRAGYSENTSSETGYENLRKPQIIERIAELQKERFDTLGITQERVLLEYARLAFLDIRKLYDENGNLKCLTDLDDDTAAAVSGLEITKETSEGEDSSFTKKVRLSDKRSALDSLGKHLGLFEKDNQQKRTILSIGDILNDIDGSTKGPPQGASK